MHDERTCAPGELELRRRNNIANLRAFGLGVKEIASATMLTEACVRAAITDGERLQLDLSPRERAAARRVVTTLHAEAEDLGAGVLAQVLHLEADELQELCRPRPHLVLA